MTSGAWWWVGAALVAAAVDWVAVARRAKPVEYVAKPAALALLVVAALALEPTDAASRVWFVAALVLSLAGDVFLMLPRDLFVAGLASFLLGHVAYIGGLVLEIGSTVALVPAVALVAVVAVLVGGRIRRAVHAGDDPGLLTPVTAYIVVISVMVACALATGDTRAIPGAALFYVSDALIAWNRFVRPLRWAPVAIIVTYHLAQVLLTTSLSG